jgi:hypothetical protein
METITESLLLVLDNDSQAYHACMERTSRAVARRDEIAANSDAGWTADEAERFWLADSIKDHIETLTDDAGRGLQEPASLIVAQLFRDAIERVEWDEVAVHYLNKLRENATA